MLMLINKNSLILLITINKILELLIILINNVDRFTFTIEANR